MNTSVTVVGGGGGGGYGGMVYANTGGVGGGGGWTGSSSGTYTLRWYDDGSAGVREPRAPQPSITPGAMALALPEGGETCLS